MHDQVIFNHHSFVTSILLSPSQLDHHYIEHLLTQIRDQWENKCHKDVGYIHKIVRVDQILQEEVMNMIPNVIFLVKTDILHFYPTIGNHLPMTIDVIFNQGIFGYFHKIKILVPIIYSEDIFYIQQEFSECMAYTLFPTKQCLRKGNVYWVELRHIRFEKETFSCIAAPFLSFQELEELSEKKKK